MMAGLMIWIALFVLAVVATLVQIAYLEIRGVWKHDSREAVDGGLFGLVRYPFENGRSGRDRRPA